MNNFKQTLCKNRKMEPLHTGYAFKDGLCASCYTEQLEAAISEQAEQIAALKDELDIQAPTIARLDGLLDEAISKGVLIKNGEVSIPEIERLRKRLFNKELREPKADDCAICTKRKINCKCGH